MAALALWKPLLCVLFAGGVIGGAAVAAKQFGPLTASYFYNEKHKIGEDSKCAELKDTSNPQYKLYVCLGEKDNPTKPNFYFGAADGSNFAKVEKIHKESGENSKLTINLEGNKKSFKIKFPSWINIPTEWADTPSSNSVIFFGQDINACNWTQSKESSVYTLECVSPWNIKTNGKPTISVSIDKQT